MNTNNIFTDTSMNKSILLSHILRRLSVQVLCKTEPDTHTNTNNESYHKHTISQSSFNFDEKKLPLFKLNFKV